MGLDLQDRAGDLMPHAPGGAGGGMAIGGAITSATEGSILFAGVGGILAQDNTKLFFDDTNDQLLLGAGAVGNPAYSFVGDANLGMYRIGADRLGFATAGTQRLELDATGGMILSSDQDASTILGRARIDSRTTDQLFVSHFDMSTAAQFVLFQNAAGAAQLNAASGQALSFGSIAGSGKFQLTSAGHMICPTDNTQDIGADGATRPRNIRASGKVAVGAGSASAPTLTFDAEESTGWYNPNAGELAGGCSGSVRMRITGSGLGLNGQNPTAPQAYAITNVTTDRACDADTVAIAELADIVGTLIADLRAVGLVT